MSSWLTRGFKGGESGGTKGSGKKVSDGTEARNASRSHYRTREEQFAALLANVLDIQKKLARDPSNALLQHLNRRQTARLGFLQEMIAGQNGGDMTRQALNHDKTATRSDHLQPVKRLEHI